MTKIEAAQIIADFLRMYSERWKYVAGAAQTGAVDCSGAFVWSYRRHGLSIAHGSNAIARRHVVKLLPISEARPGMAAFRHRPPEHDAYALPSKYRRGGGAYSGDLNDYYHIGLVDGTGKYVLSAQGASAGFTRTRLSGWGCVAELKAVTYTDTADPAAQALVPSEMRVTSPGGGPVRVRAGASASARVKDSLPAGVSVTVTGFMDGWARVRYTGEGYMMQKYLEQAGEE